MYYGTPPIVTNGLVLYLDAVNTLSYVSGSTVWSDMSGNRNSGSLTNGPTFSTANGGNIVFDGVDDYTSIQETNLANWSVSSWFKYDYTPSKTTIFNLPISSGNKSGTIGWYRGLFYGISSISFDTTGSIYFGAFGNGVWDNTIARFFGIKLDPTGSINTDFNINYQVGQSSNQHQTYIGNDGFLYTSGTNLGFFDKRNKETGAVISQTTAGGITTLNAYFIIDESQRKVYHMGNYTTAFGLPRSYVCKFDLDSYAVDTTFNTSGGLNAIPYQNQIFLTSDKYLYAVGSFTSYKGTPINHIVKLDQSGSLDPNFNPGSGFNNAAELKCAIDSQNRLVCYGRLLSSYSGSSVSGIVRINTDGTVDTTFTSYYSFEGISYSIAVQPDDKIIITGNFTTYSGSTVNGIVRINTDGSRDTTFNVGTGVSPRSTQYVAYVQPDGKILVGQSYPLSNYTYNGTPFKTFIRLDSSGSIDSTFNTGSGFTDVTSRSQRDVRIRNTAGTLTTQTNFNAWPANGGRNAPSFFESAFNNWMHLVYTKDSSNILRVYANGLLVETNTYSTASFQNLDLQVDRLVNSNNNVSSIQIYNRTLSQQEIVQNYNATKGRFDLT